jgi:hypothetical protein
MMPASCYLVEAALYGGILGFVILVLSVLLAGGGLLIYLVFGW